MPNINTMLPSTYLKKEDIPQPALVTVRNVYQDNVAPQGQPAENKWIMQFDEYDKGLVLNSTNIQLAAQALGSQETDEWMGRKIVIYNDPNVSYAGKITGGLRLRQSRQRPATPAAPPAQPAKPAQPANAGTSFDNMDDDIPF